MENIFFLSCPSDCDQGLIIVIEHNIIMSRVISSSIVPMYIEASYRRNLFG